MTTKSIPQVCVPASWKATIRCCVSVMSQDMWLWLVNMKHHNAKFSHLCNPNRHSINRQFRPVASTLSSLPDLLHSTLHDTNWPLVLKISWKLKNPTIGQVCLQICIFNMKMSAVHWLLTRKQRQRYERSWHHFIHWRPSTLLEGEYIIVCSHTWWSTSSFHN